MFYIGFFVGWVVGILSALLFLYIIRRETESVADGKRICTNVKDAAIAFFVLPQFLIEQGMTEVQVKMNLDAAIKQLKKNRRLNGDKLTINRKRGGNSYGLRWQENRRQETDQEKGLGPNTRIAGAVRG